MRILHYFLGFPPYRTGGLTKYAMDLMMTQVEDGNVVMALWPGQIGFVDRDVKIKSRKSVSNIKNYELINPLPVSLDEGIVEIDEYMNTCDVKVYIDFLSEVHPDVIHIHTLMGMHKEFIDAASKMGIRTVFTTHDYFGICPKVTLYRYGQVCNVDDDCKECIRCNTTALSLNKIRLMQSPLYRILKESSFVKMLRRRHRATFFAEEATPEMPKVDIEFTMTKYQELREFYVNMLEKIDFIHFNSSVTREVYTKYIKPKCGEVISITHRNILPHFINIKQQESNVLRITCLAPAKPHKGYIVLRQALDQLWEEGTRNFVLNIFSPVAEMSPYMDVRENGFVYDELSRIMEETDILVAPSIWYETFGFTVLEALSYGVPVIVSDHVGAKDVVGSGGIIVEAGSVDALKNTIASLDAQKLKILKDEIYRNVIIKTWDTLVSETYQMYEE